VPLDEATKRRWEAIAKTVGPVKIGDIVNVSVEWSN